MPLDPRIGAAFPGGFALDDQVIGAAYMGSTSHNTYVPKDDPESIDDVDIMGIVVPPPAWQVGLEPWEHWVFQREELDVVAYALRKFVRLLLQSNPNVIGLLWLRPEHYIVDAPAFRLLRERRDLFSSRRAHAAFVGYADAQLKKMENLAFQGYMGAKRKALVERHGYDCKNAAHAIRLLRMGREFLETGVMRVFREEDADEIRAIKRGEWSLEQVKAEAARERTRADAALASSPLPAEPDRASAERLLVGLTLDVWRQNGHV